MSFKVISKGPAGVDALRASQRAIHVPAPADATARVDARDARAHDPRASYLILTGPHGCPGPDRGCSSCSLRFRTRRVSNRAFWTTFS